MVITVDEGLLVSALRYALGRNTYAVDETAKAIVANWKVLSIGIQHVILRDIHEAVRSSNLPQVAEWRALLEELDYLDSL